MPSITNAVRNRAVHRAAIGAIALWIGAAAACAQQMRLDVDARDIPRRLIHATLVIPATPGETILRYVEWTPGNHNPSGPIQNVVNMRAETESGRPLRWRRDAISDTRITVLGTPEGAERIVLRLSYIASQPSVNSRSTDSYGEPTLGAINWNTLLFYPEEADKDELMIDASITLPDGWSTATPLRRPERDANRIIFDTVSLAELVDSPAIFGEHMKTVDLSTPEAPEHYMHGVAPDPEQLTLPLARQSKIKSVHDQAIRVFGPFPYDRLHYLTIVSSDVVGFGVEHCRCTIVSMGDRTWADCEKPGGSKMGVIPHEYIHCWNGKLRAPEGLLTRNYHEPAATELLWVYEGLTSYMDDVISVRSGLLNYEEYLDTITRNMVRYQLQSGRLWRPIVDTARGMKRLRARSASWEELRRRQDYYGDGALFWMEADARIRRATNKEKSLDDFCRAFFDVPAGPVGRPVEYTRADVVDALTAVDSSTDWDALIAERIESPAQELTLGLPALLGHSLVFTDEPTDLQQQRMSGADRVDLRASLGVVVDADGEITTVLLGSVADNAKLAYGMTIVGVNDVEYTADALREAVRDSRRTGEVRLLVEFGRRLYSKTLVYDGGLRYPRLIPVEGETNVIADIARPR